MKIVAICQRSWRGIGPSGGAETMIGDLVEHLADKCGWDAEAMFLSQDNRTTTLANGIPVHTRRSSSDFADLVAKSDVAITHLGGTPMAKNAAKKFGKPVVQLIHNTNEFSVGFIGSGCDLAVYNAEWVRDFHEQAREQRVIQVWESKHAAAFKVRSLTEWPSVLVRPPVIGQDTLKSEGEYITLVNLTPNKGPDIFYKLAEMNPDLKFMGVLGGYDDALQDVRQLPNVTIHPHTADTSEFYSQTRVLLMPSVYESYGRVGVEGMQYGIPTLASPTPGLQESLGQSGVLADRVSIEAWQYGLHQILGSYPHYSSLAYQRFDELCKQSDRDLAAFANRMEEVGRGDYRDS